ncbi:hypothetical protein CV770_17070 [Bradyrhizobium sp. AC87j1]|nr:hypothetical protein CV770_17070 [Bradyrhizobium sp. AC87j1]
MCRDVDPRTEADAAMRKAAGSICAVERAKWLRVALAWLDLARAETSRSAKIDPPLRRDCVRLTAECPAADSLSVRRDQA